MQLDFKGNYTITAVGLDLVIDLPVLELTFDIPAKTWDLNRFVQDFIFKGIQNNLEKIMTVT